MKVQKGLPPKQEFQPVVVEVIIESQEEYDTIDQFMRTNISVPRAVFDPEDDEFQFNLISKFMSIFRTAMRHD